MVKTRMPSITRATSGSLIARLPAAGGCSFGGMLLQDLLLQLLDVVQPRRPAAVAQAHHAAQHLGEALQRDQRARRRGIIIFSGQIGMPAGLLTLTSRMRIDRAP